MEPNEPAERALEREFMEETGLRVRTGAFLLAQEHRFTQKGTPRHEINLMFHVEHFASDWPDQVPSLEAGIEFLWADMLGADPPRVLPPPTMEWLRTLARARELPKRHDSWWSDAG